MKILVCGGRELKDRSLVFDGLDTFVTEYERPDYLVQGYCRGADKLALQWALLRRIPNSGRAYRANWERYPGSAGIIRNALMLKQECPDFTVAFPGGPGTHNMMEQSFDAGVPVVFISENRVLFEPVKSFESLKNRLDEVNLVG